VTLLEIRERKAAYLRACGTLRMLEQRGEEDVDDQVVVHLPSRLARRIESQRRTVRGLERELIAIGCESSLPGLAQPEEVFRDARYF